MAPHDGDRPCAWVVTNKCGVKKVAEQLRAFYTTKWSGKTAEQKQAAKERQAAAEIELLEAINEAQFTPLEICCHHSLLDEALHPRVDAMILDTLLGKMNCPYTSLHSAHQPGTGKLDSYIWKLLSNTENIDTHKSNVRLTEGANTKLWLLICAATGGNPPNPQLNSQWMSSICFRTSKNRNIGMPAFLSLVRLMYNICSPFRMDSPSNIGNLLPAVTVNDRAVYDPDCWFNILHSMYLPERSFAGTMEETCSMTCLILETEQLLWGPHSGEGYIPFIYRQPMPGETLKTLASRKMEQGGQVHMDRYMDDVHPSCGGRPRGQSPPGADIFIPADEIIRHRKDVFGTIMPMLSLPWAGFGF